MTAYANCLILIIHFVPSVALLQAGLLLINCLYTLWLLAFGYISSDVLLYLIFANFDTLRFFQYSVFKVQIVTCEDLPTFSGDGEIRTLDPLLARQVLSQLSYTPI